MNEREPIRICMFVYNTMRADPRVIKEASSFACAGHDVLVVALLDDETQAFEKRDGFRVARILRDPIHARLRRRLVRSRSRSRRLTRMIRRLARIAFGIIRGRPDLVARARYGQPAIDPPSQSSGDRTSGSGHLAAVIVSRIASFPSLLFSVPIKALRPFRRPLTYIDYYRRAYRLVRASPADVYHAHDLNTLPVAAALARATDGRLVYDAHELFTETSLLPRAERALWKLVERFLIRRADLVVTVCDSIAERMVEQYRVDKPLVLLNCPVRTAEVPKEDAALRLRERIGLSEAGPVVLYQGGFSPHRGLESLIRSALYLDTGTIVLVGSGRIEETLRGLIDQLGLQDRVAMMDPVPAAELHVLTSGADIGVIPYQAVGLNNYFTTPNKLFEFMAAGLPIIGSRFPELVRFITGLGIGRTFQPANQRDIAAAVGDVWADRAAYDEMATRARRAHDRYNWEIEMSKLEAKYPTRSTKLARRSQQQELVVDTANRQDHDPAGDGL